MDDRDSQFRPKAPFIDICDITHTFFDVSKWVTNIQNRSLRKNVPAFVNGL